MNNEKLDEIFNKLSNQVEGRKGHWRFLIDSTVFICLTDELHNRMRIISPIVEAHEVSDAKLKRCMEANFHSALDARYAIGDNVLWSTFIHPLRELDTNQVVSAVSQVYSCAKTFGTTYSSGSLSFPSKDENISQN